MPQLDWRVSRCQGDSTIAPGLFYSCPVQKGDTSPTRGCKACNKGQDAGEARAETVTPAHGFKELKPLQAQTKPPECSRGLQQLQLENFYRIRERTEVLEEQKGAHFIPIFKTGCITDMNNYSNQL